MKRTRNIVGFALIGCLIAPAAGQQFGDSAKLIAAQKEAMIRYTATIKGDVLHEIGERTVAGGDPVRIFEMTLKRVEDSGWPAAGAVTPN